jgi:hypothetical protein
MLYSCSLAFLLIGRYKHGTSIVVTPVNFPTLHTQPTRQATQWPYRGNCCRSAGAVRIADSYADAPQAWFRSINATFAVSRVTKPLTSSTGRTPSCPRRWSTPSARSATIPAPLPSYSVKYCPHMDSATTRGLLYGWTPLASGRTRHQSISPDGPSQRPEASLGGREGPVPPQDAPPTSGTWSTRKISLTCPPSRSSATRFGRVGAKMPVPPPQQQLACTASRPKYTAMSPGTAPAHTGPHMLFQSHPSGPGRPLALIKRCHQPVHCHGQNFPLA